MANATFVKGGTTLTFTRDPGYAPTALNYLQPIAQATGGHLVAQDLAATEKILTLSWPRMPLAEVASLRSFFTDTADGMAQTFTYTDVRGVATTVRFADQELAVAESAPGSAAVTVRLEVAA
jgi:hypothetical protein